MHFKGLDGLRAIAAMAVVFSHINISVGEFYKIPVGPLDLANFGVTLFFTLSGFLITYLLLVEKQLTKTIGIKKFYIRRLLRTWPLYLLYLFIVLVFVRFAVGREVLYYLFIVPNLAFALQISLPFLAHYWSLGVEEQFYLIWPWLTKRLHGLKLVFVLSIVGFIALKLPIGFTLEDSVIATLLHYSRFGTIAIGGLGAWYYVFDKQRLDILRKPPAHIAAWAIVLLVASNRFHVFSIIDHELFAIVTVVLIVNQIEGPRSIFSLEKRWLNYFGKISFGIYVFNPLLIHVLTPHVEIFFSAGEIAGLIASYILISSITVAVAHLSYHYFEKRFLKLKERYAANAMSMYEYVDCRS